MTFSDTASKSRGSGLVLISLLAVAMFVVMFVFKKAGAFDFWYWMSANLALLLTLVFITDRSNGSELKRDFGIAPGRKILYGLLAAFGLFLLFYAGNYLIRLIIEQAGEGIQNVYAFKQDASPWRIALLMLLIIGPGEELFWRGYLQRHLAGRIGKVSGFLLAAFIYTAVHIATGNAVLVLAALVCGVFWGWLYMKYRSMLINIVSHTAWDIAVFILLPFSG